MYFPTLCVDNFFNNPDEVRKFALSLEYTPSETGKWPGKRTHSLDQISQNYFQNFCEKLFLLNYDLRKSEVSWIVETYFQIIEPGSYEDLNVGWVHKDTAMFAGIIYLTPDIDLNCGTSIFRSSVDFARPTNVLEKKEMYLNFNKNNKESYQEKLKENNSMFEETIRFNNVYNRLVAYDGSQYHGVNKFYNEDSKPRLTQVFFAKSIVSDHFPIPASKQIPL